MRKGRSGHVYRDDEEPDEEDRPLTPDRLDWYQTTMLEPKTCGNCGWDDHVAAACPNRM